MVFAESRSAGAIAAATLRWGQVGLRLGAFVVLGLGVIPLLIGLFLELAVLPVR